MISKQNKNPHHGRKFCVAPMLDWTDRHCRYFHRLISQHAFLYTEMVTTGALIHGDHHRFLQFSAAERPVAFQLGGSNPRELAICAKMIEDYGYDEVNLNVGCPSDRVQNGRFGACLMAEPELVAECVAAMGQAVSIPVTVKSRIGIDERDSYEELVHFVSTVADAGCETFIIHARKAWLSGLSPKQNRDVPPLRYDVVYQIKQDFPQLEIILNGGITTLDQAEAVLTHVDGVMVGREAYHNPYLLAEVDKRFYGESKEPRSREMIMDLLIPYIQQQLELNDGVRLNSISRHILGLFHGEPGARGWRRHLSENACKPGADIKVILEALPTRI
ncbi:tRNA dihydrouridine(20/20a) synthase DusA [Methylobacter sp.]|uniref:tRNA dihydrouridine(20/20a) synthase DusA n=1 Tax=Methylobacter sp. TaxID=2051955 RepID=UPI00248930CB|nr:tRNA dihydrouridine(20/20a) synthase DusA [Methylobacter sp.]MDI1276100.1 tRNA dihydrouridine(20/20a) synthase DusA [Methylobacter sp.]MDI1356830.1 tRNA dihydrouridine(20/20a) synthase DusA [Methylobacter sp.]